MKGAPVILQGVVGGAAGGIVLGVGDQAIADAKRGELSQPKEYASTAVKSAAGGAVAGGVTAAGGQVIGKGLSRIKAGAGGAPLKPPADPYDVQAWNKYWEQNPTAKRSVGAAGVDDPAAFGQKAPVPKPQIRKMPPGPPPGGSEITAQPRGGTQSTPRNAAALADRGMRASNAYPRDPLHHVLPQEERAFFESKGINIDDFAVSISEGEHTATHTMGWNKKWADWIKANQGAGKSEIWQFARKMMEDFKLNNRPFTKYVKPK